MDTPFERKNSLPLPTLPSKLPQTMTDGGYFTVFLVKEGLNLSPKGLLTISEQALNC